MNWRYSLLLIFTFSSLCGCPTRPQQPAIPPPKPPEPQTSPQQSPQPDVSFGWRQLELLGGMAPLVGPAPYFVEMLASQLDFNEKNLPL